MIKKIKAHIRTRFFECDSYCWTEVFWFVVLILTDSGVTSREANLKVLPEIIAEALVKKEIK